MLSQADREHSKRNGFPLQVTTDLDITNGAQGEIVDIVLHPDEPPFSRDAAVVTLKHLPAVILVKLHRTCASGLDGLDDAVVPIQPATFLQITGTDNSLCNCGHCFSS